MFDSTQMLYGVSFSFIVEQSSSRIEDINSLVPFQAFIFMVILIK